MTATFFAVAFLVTVFLAGLFFSTILDPGAAAFFEETADAELFSAEASSAAFPEVLGAFLAVAFFAGAFFLGAAIRLLKLIKVYSSPIITGKAEN
ncbi:MAG: hypothetical protein JXR25_15065 [Pontiellaceae bacterium]|nr:hypothetical protein [Pontiellaceae bacterium]MBN2786140.1 hypothetical protein [Pontiellaceae bacterium]